MKTGGKVFVGQWTPTGFLPMYDDDDDTRVTIVKLLFGGFLPTNKLVHWATHCLGSGRDGYRGSHATVYQDIGRMGQKNKMSYKDSTQLERKGQNEKDGCFKSSETI